MTTPNQNPASEITPTHNTKRLEELWKACMKSSGVECVISFLDCSEEWTEIPPSGERTDASITKDQMRGIFLTVDSIASELKEIRCLVQEHASDENESLQIFGMIDDALKMIELASRMGRIHLSNDTSSPDDELGLDKIWVNGFFYTLKHANQRMYWLFTRIDTVCSRIRQASEANNGGDLAKDSIH